MKQIKNSTIKAEFYKNKEGWNIQMARPGTAATLVASGPARSVVFGLMIFDRILEGDFNVAE